MFEQGIAHKTDCLVLKQMTKFLDPFKLKAIADDKWQKSRHVFDKESQTMLKKKKNAR